MKRLILFRHARTQRASDTGQDFDRDLTESGQADAALTGRLLSGAGLVPDVVLVSAANRAQQTWAAAAPSLPDAHVEVRGELYEAPADALHAAAHGVTDAHTVMVIAHNPGLQALAARYSDKATLIDADVKARLARDFPTGAAVAFEIEADRTGCLGLFVPADHGGAEEP